MMNPTITPEEIELMSFYERMRRYCAERPGEIAGECDGCPFRTYDDEAYRGGHKGVWYCNFLDYGEGLTPNAWPLLADWEDAK